MGQPKTTPEDTLVPHVTWAHALGNKPASVTKADHRKKGPGGMIRLSQNRYAFPLANIKAWCAAHGLEWTGNGIRPLPKNDAPAAVGGAP